MLNELVKHLFESQKVYIPHIGTFEVHYQAARMDGAEKIIYPPAQVIVFQEDEGANEKRRQSFATVWEGDKDELEKKISALGESLKKKVTQSPYHLNGIGTLELRNEKIIFLPEEKRTELSPVNAEKVAREVPIAQPKQGGFIESETADLPAEVSAQNRSVWIILGWIILLLAALFIAWHFYKEGGRVEGAGSKLRVMSAFLRTPFYL